MFMSVMANTRALILYVFVSSFFFFVCLPHFLPSFFPSNSSSRASYQSEKEEVGYLCCFLPYNPCKTFKLKEIHFKKNAFLVKLLHSTFNVLLWCTIKAFLNYVILWFVHMYAKMLISNQILISDTNDPNEGTSQGWRNTATRYWLEPLIFIHIIT